MEDSSPVELLWTGGWDSTFRLLTLLLDHRVAVQPTYVADPTRSSSPIEQRTMTRIRTALFEHHPHTRDLLRPTHVVSMSDIAPDPEIQAAFDRIVSHNRIGDQYGWLARYCRQHDVRCAELSINNTAHGAHLVTGKWAQRVRDAHGHMTWCVPEDCPDDDVRVVFSRFSMPMWDQPKSHSAEVARLNGWTELMGMTWFCHRPSRNAQPCGLCNPCQYAIEEGFGWRIPRQRRALSKVYRHTLMPLRNRARQFLRRMRVAPT